MGGGTAKEERGVFDAYRGLLLAMVVTGVALGLLSWLSYRDALDKSVAVTAGAARISAASLYTTLNVAEVILADTAEQLTPVMEQPARRLQVWEREIPRLRTYLSRVPEIKDIYVANSEGDLVMATVPLQRAVNIADRRYFLDVRQQPGQGVMLSEVVVARLSNTSAIVLALGIRDREGRFLGAVMAPLSVAHLERLLGGIEVGRGGAASLRRSDDGRVLARFPPAPLALNRADPGHPAWSRIQAGQYEGQIRYRGTFDGIPRVGSFQRLDRYPLYVVVGESVTEVLAEWAWRVVLSGVLVALAFSAVFLIFRRLATAHARLRESAEETQKFSAVLNQSPLAITITNARGEVEYANPACCEATGLSREAMQGRLSPYLSTRLEEPGQRSVLAAALAAGEHWAGVVRGIDLLGQPCRDALQLAPIRDQGGATRSLSAACPGHVGATGGRGCSQGAGTTAGGHLRGFQCGHLPH